MLDEFYKIIHVKDNIVFASTKEDFISGRYNVYFKLDALQPSGSFKLRGIGATVRSVRASTRARRQRAGHTGKGSRLERWRELSRSGRFLSTLNSKDIKYTLVISSEMMMT